MVRRSIALLAAVLLLCLVASPTFGAVVTGVPVPGLPVTLAPVGLDPVFDFTFSDSAYGLTGGGEIYATANGDGSYTVTGGTGWATSSILSLSGFNTTYTLAVGIGLGDYNTYDGVATYADQVYPCSTLGPGSQLDSWGILLVSQAGYVINPWGTQPASVLNPTGESEFTPILPGPYAVGLYPSPSPSITGPYVNNTYAETYDDARIFFHICLRCLRPRASDNNRLVVVGCDELAGDAGSAGRTPDRPVVVAGESSGHPGGHRPRSHTSRRLTNNLRATGFRRPFLFPCGLSDAGRLLEPAPRWRKRWFLCNCRLCHFCSVSNTYAHPPTGHDSIAQGRSPGRRTVREFQKVQRTVTR